MGQASTVALKHGEDGVGFVGRLFVFEAGEIEPGIGEMGIEVEGGFVGFAGGIGLLRLAEVVGEAVVEVGDAALAGADGGAEEFFGAGGVGLLGGDEAEEMESIGVVGVFAEDGSVDFRSGGEVAAMVMGQSLFDQAGVAGFGGCFIVGGGHVFLITERCGAGQSRNGVNGGEEECAPLARCG